MKLKTYEELNWQTYDSAKTKLKTLGHKDRSEQIDAWSKIQKFRKYGQFNFAANIVEDEHTHWKTKVVTKGSIIAPDTFKTKIITPGPVPAYFYWLTSFQIDEFLTMQLEDMDELEEFHIVFLPAFYAANFNDTTKRVDVLYKEEFGPFQIGMRAYHDKGDIKIVEKSAYIEDGAGAGEFEGRLKFSDRQSAMKFKSLLSENLTDVWDEYDVAMDFFMEHSEADEWTKLLDNLRSLPISQLFKQME